MPRVDLKIYSTPVGDTKKTTTTVSYVNASASNGALLSFAQQLNGLTTNNYIETDKVTTENLDESAANEYIVGGN